MQKTRTLTQTTRQNINTQLFAASGYFDSNENKLNEIDKAKFCRAIFKNVNNHIFLLWKLNKHYPNSRSFGFLWVLEKSCEFKFVAILRFYMADLNSLLGLQRMG